MNYVIANTQSDEIEGYYDIAGNVIDYTMLIGLISIVKSDHLLTEGEGTAGGFRHPAAEEE